MNSFNLCIVWMNPNKSCTCATIKCFMPTRWSKRANQTPTTTQLWKPTRYCFSKPIFNFTANLLPCSRAFQSTVFPLLSYDLIVHTHVMWSSGKLTPENCQCVKHSQQICFKILVLPLWRLDFLVLNADSWVQDHQCMEPVEVWLLSDWFGWWGGNWLSIYLTSTSSCLNEMHCSLATNVVDDGSYLPIYV